jgi:8-oxo-dGTP pyrophosphatase MutT (NUDIX family)
MRTEKGIIAAVFDERGRVLVLKRKKNWEGWELPKGHLEEKDQIDAVLEELEEEAGIEPEYVENIEDLKFQAEWEFEDGEEKIRREYQAFQVKVSGVERIDVSNNPHEEHEEGFFLQPRHVEEMLEYDNHREVLEKALNSN